MKTFIRETIAQVVLLILNLIIICIIFGFVAAAIIIGWNIVLLPFHNCK